MAQRSWSNPLTATAALVAVGVLVVGCGPEDSPNPGADPATTQATASESAGVPSTTSSTAPSKPTSSTQLQSAQSDELCKSDDLELSLGQGEGAAGTVWRPLRFTNISASSCVLHGFPGVSFVAGDDGHQVGAAAYRDGTKGAAVTLATGQTAYAAVGFTQVANYDPAECEPTKVRGLRVYPPQETRSMYLAYPTTGCANEKLDGNQLKVQTIRAGSGPA